jgi:hypothetical protein
MKDKAFRIGQHNTKDGVITFFTRVTDLGTVTYGISFCSPSEKVYNKKTGMEMAMSRLEMGSGQYVGCIPAPKTLTHNGIMTRVLSHVIAHGQYPEWAKDMLEDELINILTNDRYS